MLKGILEEVKESLLCTHNESKLPPYCGSHMHDAGAYSLPAPASQTRRLPPPREPANAKGAAPFLSTPQQQRSVPCHTLGQAASLRASPKRLQLLFSQSPASRATPTTASIYLKFHFTVFRCISFMFGDACAAHKGPS